MKIDGEAPKDISELSYVATDTASPYVLKFDGSKAGKMVYYWLRWVNTVAKPALNHNINAMVVG